MGNGSLRTSLNRGEDDFVGRFNKEANGSIYVFSMLNRNVVYSGFLLNRQCFHADFTKY